MPLKTVCDENFQVQVIECSLPVIVIFEKCSWGTAHIMKPIIEKIASDYGDKIKVFKYDLDQNSITSEFYRIRNSTTILVFNKGNVLNETGIISKEALKVIINSVIDNNEVQDM